MPTHIGSIIPLEYININLSFYKRLQTKSHIKTSSKEGLMIFTAQLGHEKWLKKLRMSYR